MTETMCQQTIIEAFERLVSTPRSMTADIKENLAAGRRPLLKNHYTIKGQESQATKQKPTGLQPLKPEKDLSHAEHRIHEMIVKHPFLLHTPELYAGGLYLDSVLNKHRLPCGLIPDFTYITVQDRVIKITLVEIERSVKGVFHSRFDMRSTFRSETKGAIDQVRSWQAAMENDDMRRALLLNLKELFTNYPVGIFQPDGSVSSLAKVSLGYVLVVGAETIETNIQQQMVDDLYMNENILFMTYPMLIEQLKTRASAKNMLKVGPKGATAETLMVPEQLLSKGPDLGVPRYPDIDPFGIKLAGLGWTLQASRSADSAGHPQSMKQIFYRAQGKCEHAGCSKPIIENGQVYGGLNTIYNVISNESDPETYSDTNYVGLFCDEHINTFNNGCHYTLGQGHPMNEALKARRAYRPSHDADALCYSLNWQNYVSRQITEVLEIDLAAEAGLAEDIRRWSMAVVSLPYDYQDQLHQIIRAYFYDPRTPIRFNLNAVQYLADAGVISVREEESRKVVTPTIFSQHFIDRIQGMFRQRTPLAISALCQANASKLERQLENLATDEAEQMTTNPLRGYR